jgi:hypothetical protein
MGLAKTRSVVENFVVGLRLSTASRMRWLPHSFAAERDIMNMKRDFEGGDSQALKRFRPGRQFRLRRTVAMRKSSPPELILSSPFSLCSIVEEIIGTSQGDHVITRMLLFSRRKNQLRILCKVLRKRRMRQKDASSFSLSFSSIIES